MKKLLLAFSFIICYFSFSEAQTLQNRAMWGSIATKVSGEEINNGSYMSDNNKVLISWRMLPGDTDSTEFNLWRSTDGQKFSSVSNPFKLKNKGIKASCYQHAPLSTIPGDSVWYRLTYADATTADDYIATYAMSKAQMTAKLPYIEIPLQPTDDCSDYPAYIKYQANDCSVADLDGDGQMEIVVKRLLTVYNDAGEITASSEAANNTDYRARHVVVWDAYKLDGTLLWRVKSGPNIIAGNSSSVMLGDLDGDGCAEFVLKTGEGTVFGDGTEIGDTDQDGITDYRKNWNGGHYTGDFSNRYGGPEYFSVVDGRTGRELARANFIARGPEGQTPEEWVANWETNTKSWGDTYWKRANSLRMGLAKFQKGKGMQIFLGRGVYARTVVEGWRFDRGSGGQAPDPELGQRSCPPDPGTLTRLWKFDSAAGGGKDKNKDGKPNSAYAGQGNHAFNVADLDGDGLDEVMYGSCAFDNDGTGLWTTGLGHGDANHVGVFQKDYDGLQVYHCLESGKTEVALHDAKTGQTIWSIVAPTEGDQGRCMVADVDPTSPGCEFWKYHNELYDQDGNELYTADGTRKQEGSCNAAIWFDGYLSRQLIDGGTINSFSHGRTLTMYRYDITFNNGTKSNPGWYGDMLGDWREEVIVPDATRLSNIKIFSTWYPTTRRIPWLMLDHTYFMQTIHENVGYNQPTNVGFYMGSEMTDAEIWEAFAKVNGWNAAPAIVGDVNGDGTVDVADIAAVIDIMAGAAPLP